MESELFSLNQEMNQLQKENKIRSEIDLIKEDINSKQEAIDKVLQSHKETITHLLHEMPEQDVHEKITKLSNNLSNKIQLLSKDMEKERSKLSSLETTKKFHEKELDSKEKLLSEYRGKISNVCGSQDFDFGIDSLKGNIQDLQNEKGALTGSLYLFNKYITKLNNPRPKCPLCTRAFQNNDEAVALVRKLQGKLQDVPGSLEEKTRLISEKEKLLNRMIEKKPVKETVINLAEREIPELKSKLETITTEIAKTNSTLSQMEETLDDLSRDKKTAANITPDLIILDKNQRELEGFNRRLSNLKALISRKDTSRNIQQVSDEQTALQKEMKSITCEIEKIQQEVNDYREQMQQLRGRANDLRIKMCSDLQKKSTLLEQLDSMTKEYTQLLESVKEVKLGISTLEAFKNEDQVESFDGLPDLPLLKIFKFLPLADLYRCSRVCRRWFYLARDSSSWRKVDIVVNKAGSTKLKDRDVIKVLQLSTPNIEKLRISAPFSYAPYNIFDLSKMLKEISPSWETSISELSKMLKESCPVLQYFFIHHATVRKCFCGKQHSLFEHLPKSVRVLSLQYVQFESSCLISTGEDTLLPNIESFEFLNTEPSLLKQAAILSASKMVNLQELRLSNCHCVTDEDMLCLHRSGIISNLVVLGLEYTDVRSGTFNLLKQFAQRLEKLYIGVTHITDDDFYFDEDCFPNLKEICLAGTRAVTVSGVTRLLESCQNLKRVYLAEDFYGARDESLLRFSEIIQYVARVVDCDHRLNFNLI